MSTTHCARCLGVAMLGMSAALPTFAQESQPVVLPDVVVTASRSPQPLADAPGSVTIVPRQQIFDSGARELDDVLRTIPGIDLLGYSGETQHPTSNSLGMRGLGGGAQGISRALVMVNGVPINDPYFGYVQWSRVPVDNIERVEIVRGGGSPLWGNYAEGGVVNIITRDPTENGATLTTGGGSYGTYATSMVGAYRLSDTNTLEGFVGFNGTHGYQAVPDFERAPFNVPTSSDAINIHLRDTIKPSNDLVAHVTFDYNNFRQQLQTFIDSNAQQYVNAVGDIKKQFDADSSLTGTLFYGYNTFRTNNSTYFPIEFDLPATPINLNEIQHVQTNNVGGSLIWSQDFSGVLTNYKLGMDFQYIDGRNQTDHFIGPDFAPTFFQTHNDGNQMFAGWFGQTTLTPIEHLDITASGRLQWLGNFNGYDGSLTGGFGKVPQQNYVTFNPRVDLKYTLPDGFAVRGAGYTSFRAPNLGDQFYSYAAGGFVLLPNPYLQPERLVGGEVGIDYTHSWLNAHVTLYRSSISNYIESVPAFSPLYSPQGWFVVQNQNIASVLAQGLEANAGIDFGHGVKADLAYRLAYSVVQSNPSDPGSVGKQVIDVPRDTFAAGLRYQAPQGWRVAWQGIYVSPTAWASQDHTYPGYPGKTSADAYFTMNLSGSYPITESIELFAQVQNLLNRRYIVTSFSAPSAQTFGTPLTVFAGIRVSLNKPPGARSGT